MIFKGHRLLIKRNIFLIIFDIFVLLIGLFRGVSGCGGEYTGLMCLFVMAAMFFYDVTMPLLERDNISLAPYSTMSAWGLLALGYVLLIMPGVSSSPIGRSFGLLVIMLAVLAHYCRIALAAYYVVPYGICFLVLPYFSQIMLYISFPLRMMATIISASILHIFYSGISYSQTTISVGEAGIGITDACSGIQQLEVMLLVSYLIVRCNRHSNCWRIIHYLSLIPCVIIANSIRIILTVWLFCMIGESALSNFPHVALGIFQVLTVVVLFWIFGGIIPNVATPEKEARQ